MILDPTPLLLRPDTVHPVVPFGPEFVTRIESSPVVVIPPPRTDLPAGHETEQGNMSPSLTLANGQADETI